MQVQMPPFPAARFIKEIGRGKAGARSLSQDDAQQLYSAMLERRVSDLEMGGILLAMRIKGESVAEIAGFLSAAAPQTIRLQAPPAANYVPVLLPTYNGARKKANLTPLLALLLAREAVPVLVHGVYHDAGRVSTYEIFEKLGIAASLTANEAQAQFASQRPVFMPIEALSPAMNGLLAMRRVLGVRNSTHTLVKLLQPFDSPALRLCAYTHPEYQAMLHDYFLHHAPQEQGACFLMRGTEGEVVASTGRTQKIDCYAKGQCETLCETQAQLPGESQDLPDASDANTTALWIMRVMKGEIPVPLNIAQQVSFCLQVAKRIKTAE